MRQMKKFDVLKMKMIFDCEEKDGKKKDFSLIEVNYSQIIITSNLEKTYFYAFFSFFIIINHLYSLRF